MPAYNGPDEYCHVSVYLSNADSAEQEPIDVNDALVDTGSLMNIIPRRYLEQLGLAHFDELVERPVYLANGGKDTAKVVPNLKISYDDDSFVGSALVMGDQLLLGINFLNAFDLVVYPRERSVCPLSNFIRSFDGRTTGRT